ncbi:hypothetical protein ACVDG3_09585 [Meridianimarinicoccus sp. RP-17]|uniref:hypothetical protein n=1 Tax=Meridianimarinicoccus zhengii TaxID=2056810 RepID=UPI0013A69B18|nr:hypothetical protein [Phycocomes zhengii]
MRLTDVAKRWFDHLADMFGPVDDIDLPKVKHGAEGFAQNRERIRGYFKPVLDRSGL